MGRAISNDLRERLIGGVGAGKSRRAVAAQFEVAPATAVRVLARFEKTGSVEPAPQGRPKGFGKLAPYRDAIIERVKAQPDITMPMLAIWLEAEHGVSVDPSSLSKLLRAAGLTYKKNASGVGERTFRRSTGASDLGRSAPAVHASPASAAALHRRNEREDEHDAPARTGAAG